MPIARTQSAEISMQVPSASLSQLPARSVHLACPLVCLPHSTQQISSVRVSFLPMLSILAHHPPFSLITPLFITLIQPSRPSFFFFLNDPAPPEFSPFPLPAALPISLLCFAALRHPADLATA